MTLALDTSSKAAGGTYTNTTPITWTHVANAAANLMFILPGSGDTTLANRTYAAASYNGVSFGAEADAGDDANFIRVALFSKTNPATGSNTVSITPGGSPSVAQPYGAYAVTFIDAQLIATNHSSGTGPGSGAATASITGISTQSGDIVLGFFGNDNQGGNTTPSGGGTQLQEDEDTASDVDWNCAYWTASGTSTTIQWDYTANGSKWAIVYAVVRQLSGGGGSGTAAAYYLGA